MKIAIVGKGGSGKSTVSTLLALEYARQGKNVLAIDADYNMDFSYHLLWWQEPGIFMRDQVKSFNEYVGIGKEESGKWLLSRLESIHFSYHPDDEYTASCKQKTLHNNIELMTTWSHNETMIYGSGCSHSYFRPLKYYLCLVKKSINDIIIVDSVAGTDMVGYGLYFGMDAIIVVVEPTPQSMRVYEQIKQIWATLNIPVYSVANKTTIANNDNHLWSIPTDTALVNNQFWNITQETQQAVQRIIQSLTESIIPATDINISALQQRRDKHEQYK